MWRWIPIGDDFVDYFASRDTDSELIQRERDSVNVWFKEKRPFHIMRDHFAHNTFILGGKLNNLFFMPYFNFFSSFLFRHVGIR